MKKEKYVWAAVHFLGDVSCLFETEKACRDYCKRNSFNPKSTIYKPVKLYGITVGACRGCGGDGKCKTCDGKGTTVEPRHPDNATKS